MDGAKSKVSDSLQFRLSVTISIAIIFVAFVAGAISYRWAFEEAIELQDEQLIRLSALVNEQRIIRPDSSKPVHISTADPESHFVVQWLESNTTQADLELPGLPVDMPEGLQTRFVNEVSWRLLVKKLDRGVGVVVAQQTEVRDELARLSALNTIVPLLILVPLLLLLLGYLIRQVFAPLKKMAEELDKGTGYDLLPLTEQNIASEIAPFVTAINRLLNRLHESILLQRQFVRDAAHELRSPLTAISLQAERLVELSSDSSLHARLVNLHDATERTRLLLDQLLTMARAQQQKQSATTTISVKALLREVLEDLLTLADAKEIELSVSGDDVVVQSHLFDLHILIKNLVENAIRYTPHAGRVHILLSENSDAVELVVKDSGPGIPEAEQQRVFDPFYRILGTNQPGSGLGLSIVRAIADRLGLTVDLFNNGSLAQSGLSVRVTFTKKLS